MERLVAATQEPAMLLAATTDDARRDLYQALEVSITCDTRTGMATGAIDTARAWVERVSEGDSHEDPIGRATSIVDLAARIPTVDANLYRR